MTTTNTLLGLAFLLLTFSLSAQTGFYITGGSVVTNQSSITVVDGDVEITDGRLSSGTLVMTGLSGTDNNRLINEGVLGVSMLRLEDGARVSFTGNVSIGNSLWIDPDAHAELLGGRISLGSRAFLEGSTNNFSAPSPGSYIEHSDDHDPNEPGLIGNLGIRLQPGRENMEFTEFYRRYGGISVANFPTLNRYYEIRPGANGLAEKELSFQLPDSELDGAPREDVRLYHSRDEGATWVEVDAEDRFERFSAEILPYGLYAFANSAVLPVELLDFTAVATGKRKVDCRWQTANEEGSSHFDVERSADGQAFRPLGRVAAVGTTQEQQDYSFVDTEALPGLAYYRLRQVDLDGSFTYSLVIAVQLPEENGILLYPNPTQASVQLTLPTEHTYEQYSLFTSSGQLILSGTPQAGRNTIDLTELPAGLYQLVLDGAEERVAFPLQKQ